MKENFVSRQQLSLLPERIWKAEETDATKELYSYLRKVWKKKEWRPLKIMLVGSGGSYPAALAAAHSIRNEMSTPNVEVNTPQTALRVIKQFDQIANLVNRLEYDIVIGISYSGKTPDIKAVAEVCKIKKFPFILFTGAEKSELQEIYCEDDFTKIISYFNAKDNGGKEKGMISMASTLIPPVLFDDYIISTPPTKHWFEQYREFLEEGEKFVEELNISDIASSIKKSPIIHVFYEWETFATAKDIESKFIESGVANVVLHEKKNFSHGRNTILSTQEFGLLINLTKYDIAISFGGEDIRELYKNEYEEKLAQFLKQIAENKSAHYLEMGNCKFDPDLWNIQEMSKLPYFVTAIGEELDIDISKPLTPFPKEAIELYNYEGKF